MSIPQSFSETNPHLLKEWDYNKNILSPKSVSKSSKKEVWWICKDYGHSWKAVIKSRVAKDAAGCRVCRSIVHTNPELLKEWDYDKNEISPEYVTPKSAQKRWWKCDRNHSWQKRVSDRTNSDKWGTCRECTTVKYTNPEILKYWNHKKNTKKPNEVTPQAKYDVWLNCPENKKHVWKQRLDQMITRGVKCPHCKTLSSRYPELLKEWDYEKNNVSPEKISAHSMERRWWKCKNNHSWQAVVYQLTSAGKGQCQQCESIAYTDPELAKEWDYEKNSNLKPDVVTHGSNQKVWWKCLNKGHSWNCSVKLRTLRNNLCPTCTNQTSKGEKAVRDFIHSLGFETVDNNRKVVPPYEIDIFIPSLNIAIEYNGLYWHTEENFRAKKISEPTIHHFKKWKASKEKGIQMIVIWEDDWLKKTNLIKRMLKHKLGMNKENSVYARNTRSQEISAAEAFKFHNDNHIQGEKSGTLHLALFDNKDNIVALTTWSKSSDTAILDRFSTSTSVVGGFSKLLKKAKTILKYDYGINRIETYADHTVSNGDLYEKTGFSHDGYTKPYYSYFYKGSRLQRYGHYNSRIEKFKNHPNLKYEKGLSERELAELNGLKRIYDYGKTRYVMDI